MLVVYSQKNKERIGKFMQTGNTDLIYRNELDKAYFQHDMACGKSKDLVKRTQSDKVLKVKAIKIPSEPKHDDYQRGLASMIHTFFDKKCKGSGIVASLAYESANARNYQLANELHKLIIRKFKKRRVYSSFLGNIWGADLADIQSLSKYNKGVKYLLCAIDLFSKNAWVVPTKDKDGNSVLNAFKKIISEGSDAESKGRRKPIAVKLKY